MMFHITKLRIARSMVEMKLKLNVFKYTIINSPNQFE